MVDQLRAPLQLLGPSQYTIVLRGLRGVLNWIPMMPRCNVLQSGCPGLATAIVAPRAFGFLAEAKLIAEFPVLVVQINRVLSGI